MQIGKILNLSYAVICYLLGMISFVYFVLFTNSLYLPNNVNSISGGEWTFWITVANLTALSLFGIQHSVMARQSFKRWLTKIICPEIERATYVLFTALAIFLTCFLWVPTGSVVWHFESELSIFIIRTVAGVGWLMSLSATFMLSHFQLFGLSQSLNPLIGKDYQDTQFRTPGLYKIIRHPIQTGMLIGMWAVPISTTSHIMFVGGFTIYTFVGLYFEEKDLIREFGDTYVEYMNQVKRLFPF